MWKAEIIEQLVKVHQPKFGVVRLIRIMTEEIPSSMYVSDNCFFSIFQLWPKSGIQLLLRQRVNALLETIVARDFIVSEVSARVWLTLSLQHHENFHHQKMIFLENWDKTNNLL